MSALEQSRGRPVVADTRPPRNYTAATGIAANLTLRAQIWFGHYERRFSAFAANGRWLATPVAGTGRLLPSGTPS
jgi:hypothetical protein